MRKVWYGLASVGLAMAATARGTPPPPRINLSPPPPVLTIPSPPPPVAVSMTPGPHDPIPRMNPGNWVTANDYPTPALRAEQEGTTAFKLTVGIDGAVSACEITQSSGTALLDQTTCGLMTRRARFWPALDADNKPVAGTWSSRMRWVIPEETPAMDVAVTKHPVPGVSVIAFTVGKDGSARDCRVLSGPDPVDFLPFVSPCAEGIKFPVYTDAKGNPVERRVRMTFGVTLTGTQPAAPPRKKR